MAMLDSLRIYIFRCYSDILHLDGGAKYELQHGGVAGVVSRSLVIIYAQCDICLLAEYCIVVLVVANIGLNPFVM